MRSNERGGGSGKLSPETFFPKLMIGKSQPNSHDGEKCFGGK